ncbi:MAG: DUF3079 domain-containing protein [Betaproteobacteria bacterium]|jgi:hypothetical protein
MLRKIFPIKPAHPERICWGCDRYCPVDSIMCGNGSDRTQHPCELLGDDWITYYGENYDPTVLQLDHKK